MCKARRPLAKAVGLKITGSIKTAPALTTIICLRISVDEAAERGYGSERYAQGGVEVMPCFVPCLPALVCCRAIFSMMSGFLFNVYSNVIHNDLKINVPIRPSSGFFVRT